MSKNWTNLKKHLLFYDVLIHSNNILFKYYRIVGIGAFNTHVSTFSFIYTPILLLFEKLFWFIYFKRPTSIQNNSNKIIFTKNFRKIINQTPLGPVFIMIFYLILFLLKKIQKQNKNDAALPFNNIIVCYHAGIIIIIHYIGLKKINCDEILANHNYYDSTCCFVFWWWLMSDNYQ